MATNLSRFFYKRYFEGIDFSYLLDNTTGGSELISSKNQYLLNANRPAGQRNAWSESEKSTYIIPCNPQVNTRFTLLAQYPGLITGTGIVHEAKIDEEFKLGMHFDYTYGMPVIYGSSVKGVLRSAFDNENYIKKVLNKDDINVEALKNDIFEGKENNKNKSVYSRDIFFDAVIVAPDSKGRILVADSLTPHNTSPLKNPRPITFVKIAPGCRIEFRFRLTDSLISVQQKKDLFMHILKYRGAGAKTNVGYGQFE